MTGATLFSTMYTAERSTPSVVLVDCDVTKLTSACGATAPDHCTSMSASPSSPLMPGSGPLSVMVSLFCGTLRPNSDQNVVASAGLMLVRPTIAMVCPAPLMPAFQRG